MKTNKRLKFFLPVAFLLCPTLLSGQGYVNLSNTSQMSELPFIIAMPHGEIMAAWTDGGHFNGGGSVRFRIHTDGSGWSPMQQVAEATSAFPQLAVDSSGNVHMAYWEGSSSYSREIYYRKYSDGAWSNKEHVFNSWGYNSSWQRINVEGSKIYVLWCHNYTPPGAERHKLDIVLMEKYNGGSWPSSYQNVSRLPNSVSVHPFFKVKNGNVYAAWMDDNHERNRWNIYYTERINGYWQHVVRLSPGSNQYTPAVDVDDNGTVHLIFSGKGGPIYYMRKPTGGSWSSPAVISTARTTVTTINFMKYANGMLHGVWRQKDGTGDFIYYAQGSPSGNWQPPIKVSHGGQSEYPGLDVDKSGRVHVIYSDIGVGGQRDVFYVRTDQVTSYPVASFTASPTQGDPPLNVSFDASDSYDPDGKIVSYDWTFGDKSKDSGKKINHTYNKKGIYTATLTVTDDDEQSSSSNQQIIVGSPPVAKFTAIPTVGSAPLEVFFDASESYDPDGNIVSSDWDFGDNTTAKGATVSHTYTKNATFIVTLTVRDDDGLEDKASTEITLSRGPSASFTYAPKRGEVPLKVSFDASRSKPGNRKKGRIISYEWDFGDGEGGGSGKKPSHKYTKGGTYTITLKITDDQNRIDSATGKVTVYSKPVARFSLSPKKGVAPLEVSFDASSSTDEDGTISSYEWRFGDGTTGKGMTATHTYTRGGTLKITLTVTDNDGWTDSTSQTIEVIEKPYPPVQLSLKKIINSGLYFSDFINILEWQPNPKNTGKIAAASYLIFRTPKETGELIYLTTVDANTFRYEDTMLASQEEMKSFTYEIWTVDIYGRQSDPATIDPSK